VTRRFMLKPDPMRYSRALPTRISGPEWIEPDFAENETAESSDVLAFHHLEELSADLALDLRLHEILEHALLSTAATGAVIALASGDEMVCRATWGEKAPSVGAFVNTRSGLSGLCVQTREIQRCDDALTDPRVNADVCRALDIRSLVVLPILEDAKLWGIFEIFSSGPCAFSDADSEMLQDLGGRVSQTVREAVEGRSLTAVLDPWMAPPEADPEPSESTSREALAHEITVRENLARENRSEQVLGSELRNPSPRLPDYYTGLLTAAVIILAVLLGWMVGRVGRSTAMHPAENQFPVNPGEVQAAVQVIPQTAPTARAGEPAASVKSQIPALVPAPAPKPIPRAKPEAAEPSDGLVVYEQGKVVFRMAPSPKPSASGSDTGPVEPAVARQSDSAGDNVPVFPSASDSYLLERVDPEYPDEAKQHHIQGPVVLNALVGIGGAVRELKVISGDPMLVKAATDAVRQWRFQPHRLQGRLVEFETRITVNFELP